MIQSTHGAQGDDSIFPGEVPGEQPPGQGCQVLVWVVAKNMSSQDTELQGLGRVSCVVDCVGGPELRSTARCLGVLGWGSNDEAGSGEEMTRI